MKITAGPASVIRARAPKFAIRWISNPMGGKQLISMMPPKGYGAFHRIALIERYHCDALSQLDLN
jgi:hypothetical protein